MTEHPLTPDAAAADRLPEILRLLHAEHPDAKCALDHHNALELLIATILSAQCTDERVNQVTPALFNAYPTAAALAAAAPEEVEALVRPTGFYRNKTKNIQAASRRIELEYGGTVPATMQELLTLPGVARKTANVVLGTAYGVADGIVVDTHVWRLSQRLQLTAETSPEKIERDLMTLTPREEWIDLAHLLIFHGRRVCTARKPACGHCVIIRLCPSASP